MVMIEKDFPLRAHDDKKMTVQRIRNEKFLKALVQFMGHLSVQ
jgi:hypothetical protein